MWVQSLVGERRFHIPWGSWACVPQLPKPTCSAAQKQQMEPICTTTKESRVLQRRSLQATTKARHSQINKYSKKKKNPTRGLPYGSVVKNLPAGLSRWFRGRESPCQYRTHGFNLWSRNISHVEEQLSPCTTNTEACVPWSLCSTTRETTSMRSLCITTRE